MTTTMLGTAAAPARRCDFWDTQFDKVLAMPPAERALRRASQSLPELS